MSSPNGPAVEDRAPEPAAGRSPGLRFLQSKWALAAALLLIFGFYCATQTEGHDFWAGDYATYVAHARNLATGHPYTNTGYIPGVEAHIYGTPTFPPGYPLLLAPVYRIVGLNYRVLKTYTVAILVLSLAPIYFLARRTLPPPQSLLIAVFLGFGFMYLWGKDFLASEGTYQLASFGALLLLYWIYDAGLNRTAPLRWGLLLGVLLCFVYLTRSIGAALFLGMAAYDVVRNRRLTRFLIAAGAAFAPLALLANRFTHLGSSYSGQFATDAATYLRNALDYGPFLSYVWMNDLGGPFGKALRILAFAVTSLLALLGLARRIKKEPGPAEFYLLFYTGALIVYQATTVRYLIPVAPLYLIYAFEGVREAAGKLRPGVVTALRAAGIATMAVTMATESMAAVHPPKIDNVTMPAFVDLCRYVKGRMSPESLTIFCNPRVLALSTDRKSARYLDRPPDQEWSFFESWNPDYVVYSKSYPLDLQFLAPVLREHPQRFHLIYENPDYQVFEFVKESPIVAGSR